VLCFLSPPTNFRATGQLSSYILQTKFLLRAAFENSAFNHRAENQLERASALGQSELHRVAVLRDKLCCRGVTAQLRSARAQYSRSNRRAFRRKQQNEGADT